MPRKKTPRKVEHTPTLKDAITADEEPLLQERNTPNKHSLTPQIQALLGTIFNQPTLFYDHHVNLNLMIAKTTNLRKGVIKISFADGSEYEVEIREA